MFLKESLHRVQSLPWTRYWFCAVRVSVPHDVIWRSQSESRKWIARLLCVRWTLIVCFSDLIHRSYGPKWQRLFQSRWKSPRKWIWWNRCRNLSQQHTQRARSRGSISAPWRSSTSFARTRWEGRWTNMRAPWRFCSGRHPYFITNHV